MDQFLLRGGQHSKPSAGGDDKFEFFRRVNTAFAQLAAIGLILVMLGAIQKKIFVWHTGFWGKTGTDGWSYDTMLVVMNLVIITTASRNLTLTRLAGFR